MLISRNAHTCSENRSRHRQAIVTLETIIWLPVIAILLAGVIEMGLLMTGSMHVAAASRLGAKLAAETPGLDASTTAATAMAIRGPVDDYLQNAGYGPDATEGVRLQHNIGMTGGSEASGNCPEQNTPALPAGPNMAFPNRPNSVRVVVCVNATTVAPNLLKTFGFDTSNTNLELSTTYPYERLP